LGIKEVIIMKRLYLLLMIITILFLSGCQSPAEDARMIVFDIYNTHEEIEFDEVTVPDDFYYSGFASFTTSNEDGFTLILLKDDIYSELLISWDDFDGNEVSIKSIQIKYFDLVSDKYFSLEAVEEGYVYEGMSYEDAFKNFSSIRIDDIKWIIDELGYEIQ